MSSIAAALHRIFLGEPVACDALTIVPLLREPNGAFKHDYISLAEALKTGQAKVTEVSESGHVPDLTIHNHSDVAVFILDGEELLGAKQNRIVNLSILVAPKQKLTIPVSCVERGRWSYRTREFHVSPYTVFATGRAGHMSAVTNSLRSVGGRHGNQHKLWEAVAKQSGRLGNRSPTEAMYDAYEARRGSLDRLLAGLAPHPNQVGAVFAVGGHVVGADLFESPELLAIYFGKTVRSYALGALLEQADTIETTEVEKFLADLRCAPTSRFRSIGLGDDLRIEDQTLTGGALVLDDRLIHLAAFRRDT
jgi:ARG/rhodanese/phosphatase superfamily protein